MQANKQRDLIKAAVCLDVIYRAAYDSNIDISWK